jgi:hypothetical protein
MATCSCHHTEHVHSDRVSFIPAAALPQGLGALERDWSGVSGSILEGIDEILTATRLGLPKELRRSLACSNIVEN